MALLIFRFSVLGLGDNLLRGRLRGVRSSEFEKVCEAVRANHSVLVLGEAGMGVAEFAQSFYEELLGDFQAAIATYKGSVKKFFTAIAFQLDIPTTETQYNKNGEPTGERNLTVDAIKEEIAANCSDGTLLILPEAKRSPHPGGDGGGGTAPGVEPGQVAFGCPPAVSWQESDVSQEGHSQ